jgi:hypothetical protein
MRPSQHCPTATSLWILATLAAPACVSDSVPPDIYARDTESSASQPGAPATELDPAGFEEGASAPPPQSRGDAGSCDLRGHWLITQHTVASGLGVKQRAAWWLYYELEQNGSDLNVKKGLVCGSQVFPIDALSAGVEFTASFPTLVEKNSHAGRRGTVLSNGGNCNVSFERAYIIVGATTPFYADPENALPTLDEPASGTSPGWEDWDEDGEPAVSLHVSGLVQGSRYTVIRAFGEWSGAIASGATNFQLPVPDWGQDEAVLGVTAEVLKQTGVPDSNRAGHFTQFAKLTPEQVQEDAISMCESIRRLAPLLTPDANR